MKQQLNHEDRYHPSSQKLPDYAIGHKQEKTTEMNNAERERLVKLETKIEIYDEWQKDSTETLKELKEQMILLPQKLENIQTSLNELKAEKNDGLVSLVKKNFKLVLVAVIIMFSGGAVSSEIIKLIVGIAN